MGDTDADRGIARHLDVGAVAGAVQPVVHDRGCTGLAIGDVLAPTRCRHRVTTGLEPLTDGSSDRRSRIVVGEVGVARHMEALPLGRSSESRGRAESAEAHPGSVGVHELKHLGGERRIARAPGRRGRTVTDGCGCRRRSQGEDNDYLCDRTQEQRCPVTHERAEVRPDLGRVRRAATCPIILRVSAVTPSCLITRADASRLPSTKP